MAFEIVTASYSLFAAPRYLKSGLTTIPEVIDLRYDRNMKLWFAIAYILLYIVVQIPVYDCALYYYQFFYDYVSLLKKQAERSVTARLFYHFN